MSILAIVKPINSEKSVKSSEKLNTYTFKVNLNINKLEIKREIERLYSVTVVDVRTLRTSAKNKSRYTKKGFIYGRTSSYKKAYVKLKEGDSINFYAA